jgi:predicted DCC family thiol-disulfide oxidoreductase YuxK
VPYGAWDARINPEPNAAWRLPAGIRWGAWIMIGLACVVSALIKLGSLGWYAGPELLEFLGITQASSGLLRGLLVAIPHDEFQGLTVLWLGLEMLCLALLVFRISRPWVWLIMVLMQAACLLVLVDPDPTQRLLLLLAFAFNPAWLPPRRAAATVFYDGQCALCHGGVRLLLAEDQGAQLRFAPLYGETWQQLPEERRRTLPDSLVVKTDGGDLLTEDAAVRYLMDQLGGLWRVLGWLYRLWPRAWQRWAYRVIVRRRLRWFGKTTDSCPLMAASLRRRFMA